MFIVINVIDTNLSLSTSLASSLILYKPHFLFTQYFLLSKTVCNIAFVQVVPKLAAIVWLRVPGLKVKQLHNIYLCRALQCCRVSLDSWHCYPDMKSLGCFTMTSPRADLGLQGCRQSAPGEVKTRGLIIREWGSTLHCITDTLQAPLSGKCLAWLSLKSLGRVYICMLRGLAVYLMVEVVVASVSMMYEPRVRCPIWSDNVIPTHSEHL